MTATQTKVGVLLKAYYLSCGKRYCWLDLDAEEAAFMLAYGFVVKGGRWYWSI